MTRSLSSDLNAFRSVWMVTMTEEWQELLSVALLLRFEPGSRLMRHALSLDGQCVVTDGAGLSW